MDTLDLRNPASLGAPVDPSGPASLLPRELAITVRYRSPDTGERHEAVVLSRVPTQDDRCRMARVEADMAGGRAWDALPPDRQTYIRAFATVAIQLRNPSDPKGALPVWLSRAIGEDEALLTDLFAKCAAHVAIFFGADGGTGPEDSGSPRMDVSSPVLAAAIAQPARARAAGPGGG